mmetsp:Transcript_629/g.2109  ORF Transcript_629/g.2109 Transcript_629/m.2109 type:complete len:323 (-) Transcript_629:58-1026(-)
MVRIRERKIVPQSAVVSRWLVHTRFRESPRDVAWYPRMKSADPVTCVFASCCKDNPVHLWDAYNGTLRASYRCFDAMDEITAPYSIAFEPSGTRLFLGFESLMRVFDIARPGRDCSQFATGKRRSSSGQLGILSCMQWAPEEFGYLAVGSFTGYIGVYARSTMEKNGPELCWRCNVPGIICVKVSSDGQTIVAAGRKDNNIYVYDLRNPKERLFAFSRSSSTNQRIGLDIDRSGAIIVSGSMDSELCRFNLTTGETYSPIACPTSCVSDVSLHPYLNAVGTAHGQRPHPADIHSDDEISADSVEAPQPATAFCIWTASTVSA